MKGDKKNIEIHRPVHRNAASVKYVGDGDTDENYATGSLSPSFLKDLDDVTLQRGTT